MTRTYFTLLAGWIVAAVTLGCGGGGGSPATTPPKASRKAPAPRTPTSPAPAPPTPSPPAAPDAVAPTCSATPTGGLFADDVSVSLAASEPATIYYTLDGSDPTTASAVYQGPLPITRAAGPVSLRFLATDSAGNVGVVVEERYEFAEGWSQVASAGAPRGRAWHTAVTFSDRVLVWGGEDSSGPLADGGDYRGGSGWRPAPGLVAGGPAARSGHVAIAAGARMLVWGGAPGADGAAYDTTSDAWAAVSTAVAPQARRDSTGGWLNDALVVTHGRAGAVALADGGAYDPVADVWRVEPNLAAALDAPSPRHGATSLSTGDALLVWGGRDGNGALGDGGRLEQRTRGLYWLPSALRDLHDPTAIPIPDDQPPSARFGHTAVLTDHGMIVWGGTDGLNTFADGACYEVSSDSWGGMSAANTPRAFHTAVWTGQEMIVWGGVDAAGKPLGDGAAYDPFTDTWRSLPALGDVAPRYGHTAVWTGTEVFIWGGTDGARFFADGARYVPPPRPRQYVLQPYGITVDGASVIYVLDASSSMVLAATPWVDEHGQLVSGSKFERARWEVQRNVLLLPAHFEFNVVAFAECQRSLWQSRQPASDVNKATAVAWLRNLVPRGWTNIGMSVALALQDKVNNTVVLASDGQPNFIDCALNYTATPDQHRALIRNANTQVAAVHVVSIGPLRDPAQQQFLQGVAADAGGSYIEVP